MSKSKIWLLVAAVVAMLVLGACAPATPAATPEPTEEETAAPTAEPTEEPTEAGPLLAQSADCADSGSKIQEIAAVDASTVRITLCGPDPSFLAKIALPSFGVQPKAHIEETAESGELLENPIGTGPYKLEEWAHGESVILSRNDDYWGEAPAQATLVFRWNSEPAARLLALQSGEADGMANVGRADVPTVEGDSTLQLKTREPMTIVYVGMTNTFAPWDNADVRKAMAMGIDRQRFVDNYFPPGTQLADYFTPCIIANGCEGDPWYSYDPDAAKALLASAGYPDGLSTKIYFRDVTRPYAEGFPVLAQELQTQLAKIGVTTELVPMESPDFIGAATGGELDGLFLLGWTADYPHITNFLDAHFSAGVATFGTPDDELVSLLTEGAGLAEADAADVYAKANNRLREIVPMVPIAHSVSSIAFKADVANAYASPLSAENFALMDAGGRDTFVWIQGAEPGTLYAGDESDGEALHIAQHITEGLYVMTAGADPIPTPALATECKDDGTYTVWTCTLREGVKFSDGSDLTAEDVAFSLITLWDFSSPFHKGKDGEFYYMDALFGGINKPAS